MIGIFGGTFDPVHNGHLRVALEVKQSLPLEEIRFIPCANPPHRPPPHASAAQRQAMLQLALYNQPGFVVDDRELVRGGPSYMVDTLQSLHDELPGTTLCLLLGMDAFTFFDSWHRYLQILSLAHIVVMQRPGSGLQTLQSHPAVYTLVKDHRVTEVQALTRQPAGCIWFEAVTPLAISSTEIRTLRGKGRDIRFLVPERVYDYIQHEQLYC